MPVITVTAETFDRDVLGSDVPVLLDFWAAWCGPCRAVAPVLEQIADEYAGRLVVGKVDVDQEGDLATRFAIRGIPTLIVLDRGAVHAAVSGAGSKAQLVQALGLDRLPAAAGA